MYPEGPFLRLIKSEWSHFMNVCMYVPVNACIFRGIQRDYLKFRKIFEKQFWMQILEYEDIVEEQIIYKVVTV